MRISIAQVLAAFGLLFCTAFPSAAGADERSDYDEAIAAIDAGRYEEAVRLLNPICAKSPGDLRYRSARGYARFFANDMEGVIEDYEAILAMPKIPSDFSVCNTLKTLVTAHLRIGRHEKALAYATRAIEEFDEDGSVFHARAEVYVSLGCLRNALHDCQEGLKRSPDDLRLLEACADTHMMLKEYRKAIEGFEHLTARTRNNADKARFHAKCAFCHLRLGRLELARSDAELSISFDPADPSVHCLRGEVLFKLQEFKKAAEAWRRANELRASAKRGQRIALEGRYPSEGFIRGLIEKAERRNRTLRN